MSTDCLHVAAGSKTYSALHSLLALLLGHSSSARPILIWYRLHACVSRQQMMGTMALHQTSLFVLVVGPQYDTVFHHKQIHVAEVYSGASS